ncbi:MAG: TetR/AcrR family transcriptional regulator [Oligoflexales bacterium]
MKISLPPKPSKREVKKKTNYDRIVNAAKIAFLAQGFEATTIRDIIRQSGLAPGTFYNYFPDKESVFRVIVDHYLLVLSEKLKKTRRAADSLQAYIEPTFLMFFKHIGDNSELYCLTRRNESALTSFYQSSLMEMIWQELIADIEQAVVNCIIPKLDSQLLAASFIGLGHELARLLVKEKQHTPEEMADFASKMFIGGLAHYQKNEDLSNHREHQIFN